jgi:hypothetical protein
MEVNGMKNIRTLSHQAEKSACMDITAIRGSQLDRDGFFVWPRLFDVDLIDAHLLGYEQYQQEIRPLGIYDVQVRTGTAEQHWHHAHLPTLQLIYNQRLLQFLRSRFQEEPVMSLPMTGLNCRRTTPHNDSTGFVTEPRGARLRVWIALEDIHADSGPVYFVAGSHHRITATLEEDILQDHPELRETLKKHSEATSVQAFEEAMKVVPAYVAARIESQIQELGLDKVSPSLKKGDAVIFDVDTVHGSSPWIDGTLTRKHLIVTWSAFSACWFGPRVYWGPHHDFRCPQNAITFPVVETSFGYRLDQYEGEVYRAPNDDYSRPLVKV